MVKRQTTSTRSLPAQCCRRHSSTWRAKTVRNLLIKACVNNIVLSGMAIPLFTQILFWRHWYLHDKRPFICIILEWQNWTRYESTTQTHEHKDIQCASKLRNILGEIFLRGVSGGVGKRYFYDAWLRQFSIDFSWKQDCGVLNTVRKICWTPRGCAAKVTNWDFINFVPATNASAIISIRLMT